MTDPYRRAFLRSSAAAIALAATRGAMPFTAAVPLRKSVLPATPVICCGLNGVPTGGSFTLSLGGATTEPIAWSATAEVVRAACHRLAADASRGAA